MNGERTWLRAGICTLILLVVYGYTMAPTLTWAHYGADGGDLARAVARSSVPHPPGFPTYLLMGAAFVRLPINTPAWRLNLLSAVSAAAAGGLLTFATARLLCHVGTAGRQTDRATRSGERTRLEQLVPPLTGLSLGLAPLFWSQALITEVYAPAALFATTVIVASLYGAPAYLLGSVWGIGIGVHPVLLAFAPLVAWWVWQQQNRRREGFTVTLFAAGGWGIMYALMWLTRSDVASPWVALDRPTAVWTLASAEMYQGYVFGLPLLVWPRRLLAWAGLLARQFTPVGAALVAVGWHSLWHERRGLTGALTVTFAGLSVYAIGYNTTDSLVYLVPVLPIVALWLGIGMARTAQWLQPRLRWSMWALVLVPVLQLTLFWNVMDVHTDRSAMIWTEAILEQAPSDAILVTEQDAHTFTLWYALDVLERRRDLTVIDADLWSRRTYRSTLVEKLGDERLFQAETAADVAARAGRPLLYVDHDE